MKNNCERAKSFIATREHHTHEMAEDYVEIVSDLIFQNGKARVCDIAELMGISHVTVIRTLKRLEKKGFINSKPNQNISLTDTGKELASFCKKRHIFLLEYLIALGVPENIAKVDVEGIEHHVSETTLKVLQKHLEDLKKSP